MATVLNNIDLALSWEGFSEYWQLLGKFRKDKRVAKLETVGLFLDNHPYIKERGGISR